MECGRFTFQSAYILCSVLSPTCNQYNDAEHISISLYKALTTLKQLGPRGPLVHRYLGTKHRPPGLC